MLLYVTDIDECENIGKKSCGEHGQCVNEQPGWKCDCQQGYTNVETDSYSQECSGRLSVLVLGIFEVCPL